jgi:tetratricopeptide (TPR) repeat protein
VTASPPVTPPARPAGRTVELVLAHTHLRLGSLALARVELETMAGMGLLDTGGIVDLAEVRWRTGDLLGAGEAASAALRDDPALPMALIIAAEAAAALGRPTEARRLAGKAIRSDAGSIDAIFAGMPRSGVWPADSAEPPPTAPTLFDRDAEPALSPIAGIVPVHERPTERRPSPPPTPLTLGLWEGEDSEPVGTPMPDPAAELEAGRAALVAGSLEEAALRFGLALRFAPALAPAVLEATDGARGPGLTLVRGDAYRLAGHDAEAQQAYVIAAHGGLPERRREPRRPYGAPAADEGGADEPEAAVVEAAAGSDGGVAPDAPSTPAPSGSGAADAAEAGQGADASDRAADGAEAGQDGGAAQPAEPLPAAVKVASTRVVASAARPPATPGAAAGADGTPAEPAAVAAAVDPAASKPAGEAPGTGGKPAGT